MENNVSHDTIELLKECSSGVRMGVQALRDVEEDIQDPQLRRQLVACRQKHQRLGARTDRLLTEYGQPPAQPDVMARGMAWLKTNAKMAVDMSDATVADVLTDGCNMGVKSLTRYLNQYEGADRRARALAKELIALEEKTTEDLRSYL